MSKMVFSGNHSWEGKNRMNKCKTGNKKLSSCAAEQNQFVFRG